MENFSRSKRSDFRNVIICRLEIRLEEYNKKIVERFLIHHLLNIFSHSMLDNFLRGEGA